MLISNLVVNLILCFIVSICINLKVETKFLNHITKIIATGAVTGLLFSLLLIKNIMLSEIIFGILLGILVSEIIDVFYLVVKSTWKEKKITAYYDDGTPPKFFITGDKHRNFNYIKSFCKDMCTRRKDVLIILGDTGFNYYEDKRDDKLKQEITNLNITLFCLHGNKENRPENIGTYGKRNFFGGKVYYEPKYPNILFAIDGETYTFEDKKYMVVGGAHSVDKIKCLAENTPYWDDEMPSNVIKEKVESELKKENNSIYGMMTHTCPIEYLPTEMFVSTKQNAILKRKPRKTKIKNSFKPDINRSTEEWLGKLEKQLDYKVWFCGHYHIDKQIDKINMMYHEIRPLHMDSSSK